MRLPLVLRARRGRSEADAAARRTQAPTDRAESTAAQRPIFRNKDHATGIVDRQPELGARRQPQNDGDRFEGPRREDFRRNVRKGLPGEAEVPDREGGGQLDARELSDSRRRCLAPVEQSDVLGVATAHRQWHGAAQIKHGTDPDAAVYDPFSKLVFVVNKGSGEATVVDPLAHKVVASIPIGGVLQFPASDGAGHVFVTVDSVPEIAVVDVRALKVTARYKLDGCKGASGLAYAAQSKLLISGCTSGLAKVLQASTGKEEASLPIGLGADATFYDPVRKLAFIPCGRDGVLEVISLADPAHISVVQQVTTLQGSRTGTVDPQTGRVYLMSSKPDPSAVPAPGARGLPRLPGSYEVLVVGPPG